MIPINAERVEKSKAFLRRLWCLENDERPAFLISYVGPDVRGGRPVRSALFSTEGEGPVRDRLPDPAKVYDPPRPTLSSGEMGRILDYTRYFIEKTEGRVPIRLTDIQGPLDSAALIMGHTEFFTTMRTHPWEVHHLLKLIPDFTIACAGAQRGIVRGSGVEFVPRLL